MKTIRWESRWTIVSRALLYAVKDTGLPSLFTCYRTRGLIGDRPFRLRNGIRYFSARRSWAAMRQKFDGELLHSLEKVDGDILR